MSASDVAPVRFSAALWRWTPDPGASSDRVPAGAWWFVTVPPEHAPAFAGPWGRTPVRARVDGRAWDTSTWRDRRHGCVLAIPARLRRGRVEGEVVEVELAPRLA